MRFYINNFITRDFIPEDSVHQIQKLIFQASQLILTGCLIFFFSTNSPGQQNNNLKEEKLNGQVKSLSITEFNYYLYDTVRYNHRISFYDKKGSKISECNLNRDSSMNWFYKIKYDSILNQYEWFESLNAKGIYKNDSNLKDFMENPVKYNYYPRLKLIFKYDRNNKPEEETTIYLDNEISKLIYTYDSNEHLKEKKYFYNGKQTGIIIYTCASDGKIIESDEQVDFPVCKIFKYDSTGKLIYKSSRSIDRHLNVSNYKYDSLGNIIDNQGNAGDRPIHRNYKYIYDSKGNWTECIESEDEYIYFKTLREIRYY